MIPTAEAKAQRSLTEWFISADLEKIVLTPWSKVDDGEGGWTLEEQPAREEQVGRLIPLTNPATEQMTLDGERVVPDFILMMKWDAVIAPRDRFTCRGVDLEVIHVQEKRDYQTKAELINRGPSEEA